MKNLSNRRIFVTFTLSILLICLTTNLHKPAEVCGRKSQIQANHHNNGAHVSKATTTGTHNTNRSDQELDSVTPKQPPLAAIHIQSTPIIPPQSARPDIQEPIIFRQNIEIQWPVINEVVSGNSNHLEFPISATRSIHVTIDHITSNTGAGCSLFGRIDGHPLGNFIATLYQGVLLADISTLNPVVGDYVIRRHPKGNYELRKLDRTRFPGCAGPIKAGSGHTSNPSLHQPTRKKPMRSTLSGSSTSNSETVDEFIDVMVLYTPAARKSSGGVLGITAEINHGIATVNTAFKASLINTRVRLAHTAEVEYVETEYLEDLDALTGDADGKMDEVHQLRNEYGADIVSLWTDGIYPGVAGVAVLMYQLDPAGPKFGFNICEAWAAVDNYTFAHELGHNLGCQHDAKHSTFSGLFPYSHGWRWKGKSGQQFRSIMASGSGTRPLLYSNPKVLHDGVPSGTIDADCARTINASFPTAAAFRQSLPYKLYPEVKVVSAKGGVSGFDVDFIGEWRWTTQSNAWLSCTEPISQNDNQTFRYTVTEHTGPTTRSAVIQILSPDDQVILEHSIVQHPAKPKLSISPDSFHGGHSAAIATIMIESNLTGWTWNCDQPWVTVRGGKVQSGNGSIDIELKANPGVTKRRAILTVTGQGLTESMDISQQGRPRGAEIAVQQPQGSDLMNRKARTTFGTIPRGNSRSKTYWIKNLGSRPLDDLKFQIGGIDRSDFSLNWRGGASLKPSETAKAIVTFRPQKTGMKAAVLRIRSNDDDENPFLIQLGGESVR